jgi:hypothetical protein
VVLLLAVLVVQVQFLYLKLCTRSTRKTGMCVQQQRVLSVVSETTQMVSVICKRRQMTVQRLFMQCRLLLLIKGPYVLG